MFSTLLIFVACCSLAGSLTTDSMSTDKYINGTQYTIKSIHTTYKQHVSDQGQCSVELNKRPKLLAEGEIIRITNKWFKVEDCRLNRAYRASCGSRSFYQIRNLVCALVEDNQDLNMRVQRQTNNELMKFFDQTYSNNCCENACTISDFLQHCSSKW